MRRSDRVYLLAAVGLSILFSVHAGAGGVDEAQPRTEGSTLALGAASSAAGDVFHAAVAYLTGAQQEIETAPAALPPWVQAIRKTNLWTDAEGGEAAAVVAQWRHLKVVGTEAARFRVRVDEGASEAWIDVSDVAISGPPPDWVKAISDTVLYTSPDGQDSRVAVPRDASMMVQAGPQAGRLLVYLPLDLTSTRSGYGWVGIEVVASAPAPLEPALPSPGFKPIPGNGSATYRVQAGDSLRTISAALGVRADELMRVNGFDASSRLLVGQVLQLPVPKGADPAVRSGPTKIREISPGWVGAEYGVVIEGESGQVLWAREPYAQVAPASLTKIVTALVVLDYARLDDVVLVTVDSGRMPDSSVMGLAPGEELTVEDLLHGLMLSSGNDAGLALAAHVAGTREAFADLMNAKVRSLGLTGSQFVNPHGLDAAGHFSTVYDLAMLAREAMRSVVFQQLASARSYATPRGKGYELGNLNQLLWRYPGADGVKIGYTDAAGRAIAASAVQDGRRVFVSLVRSGDIYADSAALMDWAFASYQW